jgi:hypothetical protein
MFAFEDLPVIGFGNIYAKVKICPFPEPIDGSSGGKLKKADVDSGGKSHMFLNQRLGRHPRSILL